MAQEQHSQLAVLGTVGFYMFVAISMTMLNKNVLNSTPLPIFLLFCQSAVAIVLLYVASVFGPIKTPKFDMTVAKALVPLTLVNVLGLAFNNACLQYVDASFHQVARGMVLPSTIAISAFLLSQYPTRLSLTAASIVTVGFFSGVLFDPNHATSASASGSSSKGSLGIVFGLASSVMSAFHAVLIKKGLNAVGGSPIALSYYNNILSTAFLAPMVLLAGEGRGTMAMLAGAEFKAFAWGAALTGFFGFLISVAAILSIKVTSPVTHMISSAVRGVLQTFIAKWIFGDIISFGRIISIFLITSGSALYVYAKSEESKTANSLPTSHARAATPNGHGHGQGHGVEGTAEEKAAFIPMTPTEKR